MVCCNDKKSINQCRSIFACSHRRDTRIHVFHGFYRALGGIITDIRLFFHGPTAFRFLRISQAEVRHSIKQRQANIIHNP